MVEKGDVIAVLDTGAYGFSMSSQYNGRPRAPEVLITERKTCIVRERENIDDLLVKQRLPPHLL